MDTQWWRLGGTLVLLVAGWSAEAAAADDPIVYSRCPRLDQPFEVSGEVTIDGVTQSVTRELSGVDSLDTLPDVSSFYGHFAAPCDLVYREPSGEERVLYDCSSTSTEAAGCAALDAAVSFDGRTIAFSVFRGPLEHAWFGLTQRMLSPQADTDGGLGVVDLPSWNLIATEAQLYLVDVETGELTALPHVPGTFDSGPAFLPDDRIAFTSTRDDHRATLVFVSTHHRQGNRIWTMDLDGRNLDLAAHHSLGMQQHPYTLRDGRLLYSSWEVGMGRPFRYSNGSVRGSDTLDNLFHLFTQAPDGAHNFAFFGQHSGDHQPSYFGVQHIAAHFVTQTGDGRVWTADYYRGNNNALGVVVGVMPEADGQEGLDPHEVELPADMYAPRDAVNLAGWASSDDTISKPMPAPTYMHPNYGSPITYAGKLGHPAALSDGLMVAWGKGPCFRFFTVALVTDSGADMPGCDVGLYRTAGQSEHPSDLEMIVDSREWHEIMGRAVVPYQAIHGVPEPDVIERADRQTSRSELDTGTPFGLLGAASILDRETHPRDGLHFAGTKQFHQQGTDTIEYDDDELCGVRILGAMPNRGTAQEVYNEMRFNPAGERIGILGEFPVRKRDDSGDPILDVNGDPDTSFLVRMPANAPYFMQSIDCEGRTLNTDQTWQSLRPGEMKTCGGCHVHSRAAAVEFEDSYAARDDYAVHRLGEGVVPLLAGATDTEVSSREVEGDGLFIDFETDVMEVFERRCTSCHGGTAPAAGLALDRAGTLDDADYAGTTRSTWYCLVMDAFQECVPPELRTVPHPFPAGFSRPQLTRYIRAYNARSSLLYWKARGERTDNRTDATFDESSAPEDRDIDFGVPHETDITEEELGLLSRWIDLGAQGGPPTRDTQRPTLHLSALVSEDAVTELRVGTVDVGDGIDPATLEVCVLTAAEECADLSGDAEEHGISQVELASPLTDPEVEVLARVSDRAGNVTEVRRTVRWLLDTPPPPPQDPPEPGDDGGSSGTGGDEDPNADTDDPTATGGGDPSGDGRGADGCGCRSTAPSGFLAFVVAAFAARRRRAPASSPPARMRAHRGARSR